MEFIFILSVWLVQILFIDLFEIMKVVGAFNIGAFVYDKLLAFLLGTQGMGAERTQ